MSTKQNDIFLESIQERFEEAVSNKEWEKIQPLYIELEANGMSSFVPALSYTMTDEDSAEYKKWDKLVNGDTETQML